MFHVGQQVRAVRVRIGDICRSLWGCETCSDRIWWFTPHLSCQAIFAPRDAASGHRRCRCTLVWLGNRHFTIYERMVSSPQGTWKIEILSKTETGPKTSKYRKIYGPRDREADRWSDWQPKASTKSMLQRKQCNSLVSRCVVVYHTSNRSRTCSFAQLPIAHPLKTFVDKLQNNKYSRYLIDHTWQTCLYV